MDWRHMALAEYDHEMGITRRFLERVPMERSEFRPHPRSTALGQLATHVARLPSFATVMLEGDEFDVATADPSRWAPVATAEELLALFDRASREGRSMLESAPEARLAGTWTLRAGERVLLSQPRWMVYRTLVMNHMVHHRAQLGTVLRQLDVPIPGTYGPSADER